MCIEHSVGPHHQRPSAFAAYRGEGLLEFARIANLPYAQVQPQRAGCFLQLPLKPSSDWVRRRGEDTYMRDAGHRFLEQFQPLRAQRFDESRYPRDIAAGPRETGNKPAYHRIASYRFVTMGIVPVAFFAASAPGMDLRGSRPT